MVSIRLWYEPDFGGRQDLFCRYVDELLVADSYYLGLAAEESRSDTADVLILLLESWREAVVAAAEGDRILLPYDFSDQYVRCFEARRQRRERFEVRLCWLPSWDGSRVEPVDLTPLQSEPGEIRYDERPRTGGPRVFSLFGLIAGIEWSLARARLRWPSVEDSHRSPAV